MEYILMNKMEFCEHFYGVFLLMAGGEFYECFLCYYLRYHTHVDEKCKIIIAFYFGFTLSDPI